MENEKIVENSKDLVDTLLSYQSSDGDFLKNDVHTYHLIEALKALSPLAFKPYIESALNWFENLDDPRDNNPRSVSSFRLLALSGTNLVVDYQSEATEKISKIMIGREGNINLPVGFIETPDTYDTFPTLFGVNIFLNIENPKYHSIIFKALDWCINKMQDINRPATLGYIADTVLKAEKIGYKNVKEKIKSIKKILDTFSQEDILKDPLQAAYLSFNYSRISKIYPDIVKDDEGVNLVNDIIKLKEVDRESYYANQDPALLDLRLLVACGEVMTTQEKEIFVEKILSSAFSEKVELSREYNLARQQIRELAIELKKCQIEERGKGIFIMPHWDITVPKVDPNSVFFMMPFANDNSPSNIKALEGIYQDLLRTSIETKLGLKVKRADDIFDTRPIMQSIWDCVLESGIIVADLTGKNPNVFYEAGLADTLGKKIIFIAQSIDDVPFDLRHRRVIIYSVNYPGPSVLQEALLKTIENVREEFKSK